MGPVPDTALLELHTAQELSEQPFDWCPNLSQTFYEMFRTIYMSESRALPRRDFIPSANFTNSTNATLTAFIKDIPGKTGETKNIESSIVDWFRGVARGENTMALSVWLALSFMGFFIVIFLLALST